MARPQPISSPREAYSKGDPLSPYLFVLCMERLVQIIDAAITQGKWRPVPIRRGGPKLSNLIFADDLVLLAEMSVEQANVIKECLNRFCQASGQR